MEFQSHYTDFAKLVFNEFVMNMNMGRVFTQEEAADYFTYIMDYTKAHQLLRLLQGLSCPGFHWHLLSLGA